MAFTHASPPRCCSPPRDALLDTVNDASWNRIAPLLAQIETEQVQRRDEQLNQFERERQQQIAAENVRARREADDLKARALAKQQADECDRAAQNACIAEARSAMDRGEITLATDILETATLQSLAQRGLGSNTRMALWLAQCYDAMGRHMGEAAFHFAMY